MKLIGKKNSRSYDFLENNLYGEWVLRSILHQVGLKT